LARSYSGVQHNIEEEDLKSNIRAIKGDGGEGDGYMGIWGVTRGVPLSRS